MELSKKQRIHERQNFKCIQCGNSYSTAHYRKNLSKYCSRKCTALGTRIKYNTSCLICKKNFEHISSRCNKAKYCSRKCYNISQKNKGKTEYICFHCHKKFIGHAAHKRKYCSKKCVGKESKKTFKPNYTTVRKAMISRELIKSCNRCGYDKEIKILGVHHKDRNRNNNNISNLEVLCPNCHSLEHLKHIVVHS